MRCSTQIYEYQRRHGRYFQHEHPLLATSWSLSENTRLLECNDVLRVQTHMCQFGMVSRVGGVGSEVGPGLKPTGFMTNSPCIARELARLCPRDHEHVHLVGGRAAGAAIYPEKLCVAICKGLVNQKKEQKSRMLQSHPMCSGRVSSLSALCCEATGGLSSLDPSRPAGTLSPAGDWPAHWKDYTDEFDGHAMNVEGKDRTGENILASELSTLYVQHGIEYATDDVSGAALDPTRVRAARGVEMDFFKSMGVYDYVPRSEQKLTGGKLIGTKRIDVNKGDSENPRLRSRMVGKEFRTGPDDALYASMPPIEALRAVLSRAATITDEGGEREVMVNDVSRAYFFAKMTRLLYIEIPAEDPNANPDMLGRLRLCLYGTRDAALDWQ